MAELSAQDSIEAVARIDPALLRALMGDKPVIDLELADLAKAYAEATKLRFEADRAIRAIEKEQNRRGAELASVKAIEVREGVHVRTVVVPAPQPTGRTAKALRIVQMALKLGNAELLDEALDLAEATGLDDTSWRSERGQAATDALRSAIADLRGRAAA